MSSASRFTLGEIIAALWLVSVTAAISDSALAVQPAASKGGPTLKPGPGSAATAPTVPKPEPALWPGEFEPRVSGASDSCAAATTVVIGGPYAYSLQNATNDLAGTCGATESAPDVWYRFVSPSSDCLTVETCGLATHDTVLEIIDACAGQSIACNDDSCTVQSSVVFTAAPGEDYYIRISDFAGCTSPCNGISGAIRITPSTPPIPCLSCHSGAVQEVEPDCGFPLDTVNGGCNSSPPVFAPIALGQTVCGTVAFDGFTRDTDWYQVTIGSTTTLSWSVEAGFDTQIGILHSPCPQPLFISGTPQAGGACLGPVVSSACLPAGTYYLFVAPQFASTICCSHSLRYNATVTGVPGAPPANDLCDGAAVALSGATSFNNGCAGADGPTICAPAGSDVWFRHTATATGCATFSLCASSFDTVLGVYDGSCTGPSLGCDDDFCGLVSGSQVRVGVVSGRTYLVQVAGYDGSQGSGTLLIVPPGAGPPNDDCAGAALITPGTVAFDTSGACTDGPLEGNIGDCGDFAPFGVNQDVWYRFVAPGNGFATVSLCAGTAFDSRVAAYADACPTGPSQALACNDDACAFAGASEITFLVVSGRTYLIRIGGFNNQSGSGSFDLTIGAETGACCTLSGCVRLTESDCTAGGGRYVGDRASCSRVYPNADCTSAFEDISETGTVIEPTSSCNDCGAVIPIGFVFTFFGGTFTEIAANSNGCLTFNQPSGAVANSLIPNSAEPNDVIAPWWDDLDPAAAGDVRFELRGAPPARWLIVQWSGVPELGEPAPDLTFQAVLFEGTGEIQFRYLSIGSPDDFVTIGVENADGSLGSPVLPSDIAAPACVIFSPIPTNDPCADCPCDFNTDSGVDSQDFFDFLGCFFAPLSCPPRAADVNRDGTVNSQDFFDFLACFFEPPPECP